MGKRKRPRARVTLAAVAAAAEVSTTTASLILSGREEHLNQFHPDTIARVRASAKRLGYSANLFASGLPSQASTFFVVVIHHIGSDQLADWYLWGFEGDLLMGICWAGSAKGVYPIVARADRDADEAAIRPIENIASGGAFGVIVRSPSAALARYLRTRIKQGQPVVVVFPDELAKWPTNAIDLDNTAVGETAAALLTRHGRKRWLLVRPEGASDPQLLRCRAFVHAARAASATVETVEVPKAACFKYEAARDFLSDRLQGMRVDGVFGVETLSSVGSLLACLSRGMKVGEDFNLVGCDCAPWQSPPLPRITSIDISWRRVGTTAMETLLDLARKGESEFETIRMRPRVIAADSCPVPHDAGS